MNAEPRYFLASWGSVGEPSPNAGGAAGAAPHPGGSAPGANGPSGPTPATTRDDITRMAREAGFVGFDGDNGSLRHFAALVAAHERERCAHVCLDQANAPPGEGREMALYCAAAIRARGQK